MRMTDPFDVPEPDHAEDTRSRTRASGKAAAAARMNQQHTWVDLQIRQAIDRGDFDDLPGAGKPIDDLGDGHDPDWWLKKLVEREHVALLPASLQLRKDDAALDERLDTFSVEDDVRREIRDFNDRVIAARYRLPEGPPLITMPREVEETVEAWRARREERRAEQRRQLADRPSPSPARRRWFGLRRPR